MSRLRALLEPQILHVFHDHAPNDESRWCAIVNEPADSAARRPLALYLSGSAKRRYVIVEFIPPRRGTTPGSRLTFYPFIEAPYRRIIVDLERPWEEVTLETGAGTRICAHAELEDYDLSLEGGQLSVKRRMAFIGPRFADLLASIGRLIARAGNFDEKAIFARRLNELITMYLSPDVLSVTGVEAPADVPIDRVPRERITALLNWQAWYKALYPPGQRPTPAEAADLVHNALLAIEAYEAAVAHGKRLP